MHEVCTNEIKIGLPLEVEDDYPPFDVEHLWFCRRGELYRLRSVPLFFKGLSLDDDLTVEIDEDGYAKDWSIVKKSGNSTAWVSCPNGDELAATLRQAGCAVENYKTMYAVNIPKEMHIDEFDRIISTSSVKPVETVFPSFRHTETNQ